MSLTGTLFRLPEDPELGGVKITETPKPEPTENKWVRGKGAEILTTPKKQS